MSGWKLFGSDLWLMSDHFRHDFISRRWNFRRGTYNHYYSVFHHDDLSQQLCAFTGTGRGVGCVKGLFVLLIGAFNHLGRPQTPSLLHCFQRGQQASWIMELLALFFISPSLNLVFTLLLPHTHEELLRGRKAPRKYGLSIVAFAFTISTSRN